MLIFIENLAGLLIVANSPEIPRRGVVLVVSSRLAGFVQETLGRRGGVWLVAPPVIRWLKLALSALQLPVMQQDPNCRAFRINYHRLLLSDGLLTEYLVAKADLPVRRFHSIESAISAGANVIAGTAIIGSNWLEFGSMSEQNYIRHLEFLKRRYPDALYYCHPREASSGPEKVFGARMVMRPREPVERLLQREGIPSCIVGVCSSSLLALGASRPGRVSVELVAPDTRCYDGWRGPLIEALDPPLGGVGRILVNDIQEFLAERLLARNVAVTRVDQLP